MGISGRRLGHMLTGLSVLTTLLAWTAYGWRESPLAVVMDISAVGIILAICGALFSGAALLFSPAIRSSKVPRLVTGVAVVAALVAGGLLASFHFLSYGSEQVSFRNGDVMLAGTLFQPRDRGPHPGVVVVHGSGPESRHEYSFYAQYLARRGIAALVYDKRGVGESTGELYRSDYGDYAEDAVAAVGSLASRSDIRRGAIGLFGFSEAEWVAPQAVARSDLISFVAVVGAAGTSPAEQVASEMAIRLRSRGYADSVVAEALALNERVFAYQRTGEGATDLEAALEQARSKAWFADAEGLPERVHPAELYAWWRSVMDFDSDRAWKRVNVPVLLLKGGKDDRSAPGPMERRIRTALREGGNHDVTVQVFPEADHMLLEWPLGVGVPPPTFADGYLSLLVDWIKELSIRDPDTATA